MQGFIFTAFSDMIINTMGMEQWNELIDQTKPESEGVYTTGDQYQDSELFQFVQLLSEKTGTPQVELIRAFGCYLFDRLYETAPARVQELTSLKDFLNAVENVIHAEVKRVHPSAYLPTIETADGEDDTLILHYFSKRKLCHVSEGLIQGAANHFKEDIVIDHPECMHQGFDKCKMIVTFQKQS